MKYTFQLFCEYFVIEFLKYFKHRAHKLEIGQFMGIDKKQKWRSRRTAKFLLCVQVTFRFLLPEINSKSENQKVPFTFIRNMSYKEQKI